MKVNEFNFNSYHIRDLGFKITPEIKSFIENNHYKKSARSLKPTNIYGLFYDEFMVGVALYGQPCGFSVEKKYGKGTVELRRFCLINEAPKNSESFFLGRTIRSLKKLGVVTNIISYADTNKGHEGIIYKAANFNFLGVEKYPAKVLRWGVTDIPVRQVYQKSNKYAGKYHKKAEFYQSLKNSGLAKLVDLKPKNIFIYKVKENKTNV